MDMISTFGMILSVTGVGLIVFSKRRRVIEGGKQSTSVDYPWVYLGGILLTILGVLSQVVVAYF